jgi:glycosyltransferase involved in cell wall biosynthesis
VSEGTSPPLKVALLIATLDQAGAEKQLALLARGLPRDQFEVDVIALVRGGHYADELRAAGIRVHVLGKRWKLDPRTLLALRALLKRLAPDVVHSWMFTANAYARLVGDGRATPPIIVAERGPDDWKSAWQHWVDRCLIARTSMLIVNAAEVARQAASRGFPADRVRVVANGLAVPGAARDTIAIDPRIRPTSRVVGYVGRLAAGKRVEDLIAAAALLRAQFPDLVLVLIGDGPERAALERGVAERGLSDLVCFVGHRADAADLMPRLDAFWLASENEGMSNSLMEAMAAGTPVVVSDIPGNRDLVEDGVTGCAVPLGDPRAFAAATERLWRDPARTAAMTTAATERIARAFAVERMVERYASLYREVVHERATPHTVRGAAAASVAR